MHRHDRRKSVAESSLLEKLSDLVCAPQITELPYVFACRDEADQLSPSTPECLSGLLKRAALDFVTGENPPGHQTALHKRRLQLNTAELCMHSVTHNGCFDATKGLSRPKI